MFKEIFLFEFLSAFKKVSTYIFILILLLLGLLLGAILSGVIPMVSIDSNTYINSAEAVTGIIIGLNADLLGLVNSLIMVTVMATAIQKDFQYNTHSLYFTKPITRFGYFFGRFFAVYAVALIIFFAQILGYALGVAMGSSNDSVGPFSVMNYLEPFLLITLPNTLFLGVILFALTTFTRNTFTAYAFSVILVVIRTITNSIVSDIDNKELAAVLEPFGQRAVNLVTEYWTPDEKNTRLIPLEGALLYNRMLWSVIAVGITLLSYFRFSFSQFLNPVSFSFFKKKDEQVSPSPVLGQTLAKLPYAKPDYSAKFEWSQMFYLARFEFSRLVRSVFFMVVVLLGVAMLFISSSFDEAIYGTSTYPVTYKVMENASGIFQFLMVLLILFYSGTMIWRDRESRVDELVNSTPIKNHVLFFSKFFAMMGVVLLLFTIIILAGISYQLYNGYNAIELSIYVKMFFGYRIFSFATITAVVFAFQMLLSNKYLGYVFSFFFVGIIPFVLGLMDLEHALVDFNKGGPGLPYSDMNGFGHFASYTFYFKFYWLAFGALLIALGLRFFARGKEKSFKARFKMTKGEFKGRGKLAVLTSLLVFIGCGSFIYYNVSVLNTYKTSKEREKESAAYEKKYKHLSKITQPRIISSRLNVDIFPEQRGAHITGVFYLKNKSKAILDSVIVFQTPEIKIKSLSLEHASEVFTDKDFGLHLFRMQSNLRPGDSIALKFDLEYFPKGFSNDDPGTSIVYNGTFFNSSVLPSIGYNEGFELGENDARKKFGLAPKPRMADLNDSIARMNNYISNDSDWIDFEVVLSTSDDQIAIAPGYLQKEWTSNGRKYFHYKMDSKILNFYSFLSARYEVKRDKWNDVSIEVYYHKGHEYNIDRMIKAVKKSLDYYTVNFSPYQHRQVRILEFPRYATFAQSFPNTIPYSESIGFIAKVNEKDPLSIDYPFYVTAHEVAHQWWAHQVIGGNVQGSTVMSETMSQYSALMVMEKEYGKAAMQKFLKYEMNRYLIGRSQESKKELSLMRCENQQYIHYNKGSVIMYALKDYIGEDSLNAALKRYIKKVGFQEPPYTNAVEFVDEIRKSTPDSLRYILTDMFETITLFENQARGLQVEALPDGKFKATLEILSMKFQADSLGKQKMVPVNDWIEIGFFADAKEKKSGLGEEILVKKVKVNKDQMKFEFILDKKPVRAGIDPYNKLIDRNPEDNLRDIGSGAGRGGSSPGVSISIGS